MWISIVLASEPAEGKRKDHDGVDVLEGVSQLQQYCIEEGDRSALCRCLACVRLQEAPKEREDILCQAGIPPSGLSIDDAATWFWGVGSGLSVE